MSKCEYYIWLVKCMGVGNPRSHKILELYDDISQFYDDCKNKCFKKGLSFTEKEIRLFYETDLSDVKYVFDAYNRYHTQYITIEDELYPKYLKNIDNPPLVLFVVGDISRLDDELLITVVGTRKETLYGKKACELICSELCVSGFSIVSGLANGGDTTAHNTALKCGARTYGFLACGIDVDYPYGKASLKNAIYKNGAIITEFLPGERPMARNFHIRNRLMSGISEGTLVIESPAGSGTLITAHCAAYQGKEVFAVPAGIFWINSRGIIELLQDGAKPVKDALDIIEEYLIRYPEKIKIPEKNENLRQIYAANRKLGLTDPNKEQAVIDQETLQVRKKAKKELKEAGKDAIKGKKVIAQAVIEPLIARLEANNLLNNKIALEIVSLLENNTLTVDELMEKSELDSNEVAKMATRLEVYGIVRKNHGNRIELILDNQNN